MTGGGITIYHVKEAEVLRLSGPAGVSQRLAGATVPWFLLMQFIDNTETALSTRVQIQAFYNRERDINPTVPMSIGAGKSVAGTLNVTATTTPWIDLPLPAVQYTSDHYGVGQCSRLASRYKEGILEAPAILVRTNVGSRDVIFVPKKCGLEMEAFSVVHSGHGA